jgi:hypothetical protein
VETRGPLAECLSFSAHFQEWKFPMKEPVQHLKLFLGFLCFLSFAASPAWAWGCKGHQIVALVAEKRLTPEAREFVEKLLKENPIDPQLKRLCGTFPNDLIADAATWPDDVRNDRKNGPWHYINIPRGAPRQSLDLFCGSEGCITKAIADQWALLKNKQADPRLRAEALRFLVHFVADLHMPLHVSTNNDRGGNCVPVRYFRQRPREHDHSYSPNLHEVWDTYILERDLEGATPQAYATVLGQSYSREVVEWQKAGIHLDDWTWESHDLAESVVYGELIPKIPVESPVIVRSCADANNVGARYLAKHLFIGQDYQDFTAPVVEEQLALAAVRLSMILNEAAATSR